jgi:hypothetical protein
MANRNGHDVVLSTVEVVKTDAGDYNVESTVTTLEYTGCSKDFAEFLAKELRETGTTYPKP